MSLAAARTDLSYSTLLALKLGLTLRQDYNFPDWGLGGLPVNLEEIMRTLQKRYGSDIQGLEWLTVLQTINGVVDLAEDYYERGPGAADKPYLPATNFFHNIAVSGFDVADSWLITPKVCREEIALNQRRGMADNFLTGPGASFYRTALKVLNPSLKKKYDDFSQIDWLKYHAREEGVENLLLWLGANNALGTVICLDIRQTPNNPARRPHGLSHLERAKVRGWNLWHPDDFRAEYAELLRRVDQAMAQNQAAGWRVFIGNVPLVTIAPLAKGVGDTTSIEGRGIYYKYYTYFPFEELFAVQTGKHLTMQQALHIDDCIRAYNQIIRELAAEHNQAHGAERYYVVDIAKALDEIAYKRNNSQPPYKFPSYFDFIHPMVNTKYYHADQDGRLKQGGIFTLDGVHPSAIGHGLLAYEFLKVMKSAGVVADDELNWQVIFANDRLYTEPIRLMHEFYGHDQLARHVIRLVQMLNVSPCLSASA
jgi:hypothetical protein